MTSKQKTIFFLIVALAVFFRYYQISQMPGGLFPDMAANGLDINLMQQGHLQPFYERGNGREALFFYMEWASVILFGKGVWQFSIVSALGGVLAVIMCYFVTYRLFLLGKNEEDEQAKQRATHIALLAMFLMAVSTWHVVLSRTAFRATLIPLFTSLTFYFLLRTYQALTTKSKFWFAFLTGASFALGFYTYIAFRIMAPILFVALLWPWLANGFATQIKNYWKQFLILVLGFVIFIFPIAKYFYTHPGSFLGRAGQVSIFNQTLYTINGIQLTSTPPLKDIVAVAGEVFKVQLLGFFTHGDLNWRQNISGYPFLSPLVSPFFGVGLLIVIFLGVWYFFAPRKRSAYWKYFLLTGWFFGLLLPVVTTAEGIPHGLRGIGVMPPIFIISAWALYNFAMFIWKLHNKIWDKVQTMYSKHYVDHLKSYTSTGYLFKKNIVSFGLKLVVVCFCLALILQTYFLYFIYAANSPENFYYFRSDLTPVSQYLIQRCQKANTYLILDQFSVQTTDYLTSNRYGNFNDSCNVPYHQVDPEHSWQLSGLKKGDQIVFTQSSVFDTKKFKQYHPEAHLTQELRNKFGQTVMAVYEIGDAPQTSQNDLKDWKTYTNSEYGFELSFPDSWKDYKVRDDGDDSIWFTHFAESPVNKTRWGYNLMIGIFPEKGWGQYLSDDTVTHEYTKVIARKDGKVYVYGYGTSDYPPDISKKDTERPLFGVEEIISTFKFTPTTSLETSQTLTAATGFEAYTNNQDGFSFKYPNNLYIRQDKYSLFKVQSTPKQLVLGEAFGVKGKEGVDYVTEGYQFFVQEQNQTEINQNYFSDNQTYATTTVNLFNTQAIRYDITDGVTRGPAVVIKNPQTRTGYIVIGYSALCYSDKICTDTQVENIFSQILSSFKFTK